MIRICLVFFTSFLAMLSFADASEVRPVRGLLYTPADIVRVREIVETDPVAGRIASEFIRQADQWMARSRAETQALVPSADAVFAYGFAGDPRVNKPWSWWGRDGEASLDRPFSVKSPHTGDIYGREKPGEMYYDDGRGWTRPSDRKVFYFKGVWNAHAVRMLHEAVDNLSLAWMLTGREDYATRALLILDNLATLRSQRPAQDGPVDWPHPVGTGYGFFLYAGNVANDRMVASALALDLVGRTPAASQPSQGNPGLSVFENIRRNYFSVFEKGYTDRRNSFQNHAISAWANLLTQAVLFGYPDDIRSGIEAAYGFIDNTIDRDGEYYELSATYVYLGRIYGSRLLLPLARYSPANYENPSRFPAPAAYPHRLRFGEIPEWFNTVVPSLWRLTTLYRQPQYGDAPADRFTPGRTATTRPDDPLNSIYTRQKVIYLKAAWHATDNPAWRRLCSQLYWQLPEAVRASVRYRREGILEFGPGQWTDLPRPEEEAASLPAALTGENPVVSGEKRIAILRAGEGAGQRSLFIRGGATASHTHSDQMAITLYARGMSLTGEYGYKLAGTPDHRGWGVQAVAHKMVVVDEDLHAPIPGAAIPPATPKPPASIDGYVPAGPAQLIEMSNPHQWQGAGLKEYRRQTWLVDMPGGKESYFVDIFRVEGGRTHDYVWNAPFVDPPRDDAFAVDGVTPVRVAGVWSLAALGNPEYRRASFNQEGRSWGERLEVGSGTIRNVGIPGEKLASHDWNPAPGNGYGFVWDVKAAEAKNDWSATWLLHDGKHAMRLSMLNPDGQTVITGKTPTLFAGHSQDVVIARRQAATSPQFTVQRPESGVEQTNNSKRETLNSKLPPQAEGGAGLRSRFVTITQVGEPAAGVWPLASIHWLDGMGTDNVGLVAEHADGTRDTVLVSSTPQPLRTKDAALAGKRGFVRRDRSGALLTAMLSEGTGLKANDFELRLPATAWEGTVTRVTPREVRVDTALPEAATFAGQGVVFSSAPQAKIPYAGNEFFTIEDMRAEAGGTVFTFSSQSVSASRLKVERKEAGAVVKTLWPNELAAIPAGQPNFGRVFHGHLLLDEERGEPATVVREYLAKDRLAVTDPGRIAAGRFYRIMATQPGDRMRISSLAVLDRRADGSWQLEANMDVTLKLPQMTDGARRVVIVDDAARTQLRPDASGLVLIPVALFTGGAIRLSFSEDILP